LKRYTVLILIVIVITIISGVTNATAKETEPKPFKTKEQCLSCHEKETFGIEKEGKKISLYVDQEKYENSVHGQFACIGCHKFEEPHQYGKVLTNRVSEKCANCHTGATFEYSRSVHNQNSEQEQPNCVDCHGGHYIKKIDGVDSPVAAVSLADTCGQKCHAQESEHFKESFHGKAAALNAENSADCVTCHGYHQILSQDNPVAMTSEEKKSFLCKSCHGSSLLGTESMEHYVIQPEGYSLPMYLTKEIFIWLILVVVTVFLLHIELDLFHRLRTALTRKKDETKGV